MGCAVRPEFASCDSSQPHTSLSLSGFTFAAERESHLAGPGVTHSRSPLRGASYSLSSPCRQGGNGVSSGFQTGLLSVPPPPSCPSSTPQKPSSLCLHVKLLIWAPGPSRFSLHSDPHGPCLPPHCLSWPSQQPPSRPHCTGLRQSHQEHKAADAQDCWFPTSAPSQLHCPAPAPLGGESQPHSRCPWPYGMASTAPGTKLHSTASG